MFLLFFYNNGSILYIFLWEYYLRNFLGTRTLRASIDDYADIAEAQLVILPTLTVRSTTVPQTENRHTPTKPITHQMQTNQNTYRKESSRIVTKKKFFEIRFFFEIRVSLIFEIFLYTCKAYIIPWFTFW